MRGEHGDEMFKLGLASMITLTAALWMTTPGCSSIDRIYDCNQICNKYKDCVDSSYDVGACESRCRDNAADSDAYQDRADDCQSCVDDRSCASAVFGCSGECVGIVP